MCSLLLKKAIPFALTFVIGSLVGGLFKSFGPGDYDAMSAHAHSYGRGEGRSCRMRARSRHLVAESKPLTILFKPDARWPKGVMMVGGVPPSVRLKVTFGAGGRVSEVTPLDGWIESAATKRDVLTAVWYAVEGAARQIQFKPETVNGLPVTTTGEVEIHFLRD